MFLLQFWIMFSTKNVSHLSLHALLEPHSVARLSCRPNPNHSQMEQMRRIWPGVRQCIPLGSVRNDRRLRRDRQSEFILHKILKSFRSIAISSRVFSTHKSKRWISEADIVCSTAVCYIIYSTQVYIASKRLINSVIGFCTKLHALICWWGDETQFAMSILTVRDCGSKLCVNSVTRWLKNIKTVSSFI